MLTNCRVVASRPLPNEPINHQPQALCRTTARVAPPSEPAADPSLAELLARGHALVVRVGDIQSDTTYSFRTAIVPVCKRGAIVPDDDGIADLAGEHPAVLRPIAGGYQVLSGHRRLAAIAGTDVEAIRCIVVDGCSDHDATIIAARANARHGAVLRASEKRTAVQAELAARETAGYVTPSNHELARVYGASPTSIAKWRIQGASAPVGRRSRRATGTPTADAVQNGHPSSTVDGELAELKAAVRLFVAGVEGAEWSEEQAAGLDGTIAALRAVLDQIVIRREEAAT